VAQAQANPVLLAAKQEWVDYWGRFLAQADDLKLPLINRVPPKEGWCRIEQIRSGDPNVAAWVHHAARSRALIWLQGTHGKSLFDLLHERRAEIEPNFLGKLSWDRMDGKKSCMIYAEVDTASLPDEHAQFEWFANNIRALAGAVRPVVALASAELMNSGTNPPLP